MNGSNYIHAPTPPDLDPPFVDSRAVSASVPSDERTHVSSPDAAPDASALRKRTPLCTGLLDYAPEALALLAFAAEDELPAVDADGFELEDAVLTAMRFRDRDGVPSLPEYRKLCLAALAILHRELTGDPPAHYEPVPQTCTYAPPSLASFMCVHAIALKAVAQVSWHGNEKHNPGQALHHARSKSVDHADCIVRHIVDNMCDPGGYDGPFLHAAALVWRCLILLQITMENMGAKRARGARP